MFRRFEKNLERLVAILTGPLLFFSALYFAHISGHPWPVSIAVSAGTTIPCWLLFFVKVPHRWQSWYYNGGHAITLILLTTAYYYFDLQNNSTAGPILLFCLLLLFQIIRPGRFKALPVTGLIVIFSVCTFLQPTFISKEQAVLLLFLSAIVFLLHVFVNYLIIRFVELEQHRIREGNELDLARRVHESLFPTFSGNERIKIHKYHLPENQIGGDFYDLVFLREGNLGIFLSDISGHGISSAMMSTAMKVVLSRIPYRNRLSPAALLTALDKTMAESYESHHATGVYIFFDFLKSNVLLANAGHPPVLMAKKGEEFQEIETSGSLMGMGIREPTAEEVQKDMNTGDRYLLYTDGLLEYETTNGTITFIDDLAAMLVPMAHQDSETLLTNLIHEVRRRPDFLRFRDDVLVLVAEIQ
ncbi:MAG TPA: hypothetical protein DEA96_01400 [Leptospiraceae bacterium]|nr:hypothetical protein [Leptospiraceae bacterium]